MIGFDVTSHQTPPWITVVIPTRDRPGLLEEAVRSALVHDGSLVVVVDDSESPSCSLADFDEAASRLLVVASGAQGPAGARNVGAAGATTEWLSFLDDDDRSVPGGLDHVRRILDCESRAVGVVFCAVDVRQDHPGAGELVRPTDLGPAFHSVKGQLVAGGFCVRRDVFEAVRGYDAMLRFSENTEFVLRAVDYCMAHGLATLSTDTCLTSIWRRTPDERSSNSAQHLHDAAIFMLTRHAEAFARDPATAAALHRIAGVNAARLRDRRQAAAHLSAARRIGGDAKDSLRCWMLRVPFLWRVAWRPPPRPASSGITAIVGDR